LALIDDLSAPLGLGSSHKGGKRARHGKWALLASTWGPKVAVGLLAAFPLAVLGWLLFADAPLGGEPMLVVPAKLLADTGAADPRTAQPRAQGAQEADGQRPNSHDGPPNGGPSTGPAGQVAATSPGMNTVTIIDGTSGKRQEVQIPGSDLSDKTADQRGDQRLAESTRSGPIPRIAPDGTRPADAFAQPAAALADHPSAPRVAIIVSGLGVSAIGTSDALAKLPGPVTFAFAPYAAGLERLAGRARDGGHEILLQVPMEPFDYPDNDPGPQTLLTSLNASQNVDRLHWLMSRLQGYVGIANYMGGRFTASEAALAPVLREAAKRGLIYIDDGSSPRSLAGQIAGANNLPYAKADLQIDAVPTAAEIDRAIARLEKTAQERGFAVGMANALPVSIDRIANWAKTAEGRGIFLVPITAIVGRGKST
jgi:uncharacterized protein